MWIVDTVQGIAVLTVLCVAALATAIGLTICCCRREPTCGCKACDSVRWVWSVVALVTVLIQVSRREATYGCRARRACDSVRWVWCVGIMVWYW